MIRYGVIEVNEWENGPPPEMRRHLNALMAAAEDLATAMMPVRSAQSLPLGLRIGPEQLGDSDNYLDQLEYLMRHQLPPVLGSDNEVVMLFAPQTFGALGLAFSELSWVSDIDRRMAFVAPLVHECYFGDEFVMALVHEVLHTYGMRHSPLEAGDLPEDLECLRSNSASGHVDQTIEGFRIDASGLDGWNKSAQEGNAEYPDTLVSVMWPLIISERQIWISDHEYAFLQGALEDRWARFGRSAPPEEGLRFASRSRVQSDAPEDRPEQLTVVGVVAPGGDALDIDSITLRPAPRQPSSGPLTAALLDETGAVLSQVQFGAQLQRGPRVSAHIHGASRVHPHPHGDGGRHDHTHGHDHRHGHGHDRGPDHGDGHSHGPDQGTAPR